MAADPARERRGLGRRGLLLGGAAVLGGGAAGAFGATALADPPPAPVAPPAAGPTAVPAPAGAEAVPFHGRHQAGITTAPVQAHAAFVALDLRPGTGVDGVARLLRLLGDDAERLTAGRSPLGADDPELVGLPSRLTVTFGFGPGLFDAIGRPEQCPEVVRALPAFATDRLDPRWCGGDLLVQVCSDDQLPLSYAVRRLVRDARSVATVRWTQRGFGPARGSEPVGTTPRNLFGQRDGSKNPEVGDELDAAVWVRDGPDWFVDGSTLVLRRIRMDLDVWDDLGRDGKELSVGRHLGSGAPVTGGSEFGTEFGTEFDEVDPRAVDGSGFAAVPAAAHALRAKARGPAERMLRRGFSFDDGPTAEGVPEAGLLFAAYQADAATAFVPVQARLAESDVLNLWVTHTGSAAFAVPPGCAPGGYVGQRLLEG